MNNFNFSRHCVSTSTPLKSSIKRNLSNLKATVGLFILAGLCLKSAPAATLDKIVAVVDKYIILQSEMEEMAAALAAQGMSSELQGSENNQRILARLIDEKLLLVLAERDTNIVITPAEVEKMIDAQMRQLAQENGGMERLSALITQSTGMSYPDFRNKRKDQMREQAYKQRLQQRIVGQFEPSAVQVREFFNIYKDSLPQLNDNYKLAHLQVAIKSSVQEETTAKKFCDSLINLYSKGLSFDTLAARFSDDPSGKFGGDLGFNKRGSLDPEFEKAAFNLEVGEITQQPVRSAIGYHIIKLISKKDLEIRTAHILKLMTPTSSDTLRTLNLLDSLGKIVESNPTAWDSLVVKNSIDKETADKGGNLGWFTSASMKNEYLEAVEGLDIGQVSKPTLIEANYHLFKLVNKQEVRSLSLDEDWNQIFRIAQNHYINQKLSSYLQRWRKTIHVENRL